MKNKTLTKILYSTRKDIWYFTLWYPIQLIRCRLMRITQRQTHESHKGHSDTIWLGGTSIPSSKLQLLWGCSHLIGLFLDFSSFTGEEYKTGKWVHIDHRISLLKPSGTKKNELYRHKCSKLYTGMNLPNSKSCQRFIHHRPEQSPKNGRIALKEPN